MAKHKKVIQLVGFDSEGEPEIRLMKDGNLHLVFNFMPPSWVEDDSDQFEDFDEQLFEVVGQQVFWEDREHFIIKQPNSDTIDRIAKFLAEYRSKPPRLPTTKKLTNGQVQKLIYQQLADALTGTFHYQKNAYGFVRRFRGGFHVIYSVANGHGPFAIDIPVGIRLDEVEKLVYQFSGATEGRTTSVTFHSKGLQYFIKVEDYFSKSQFDKIVVTTQDDLAGAFQILTPILRDTILPFLDAHSDMKSMDKLLNPENRSIVHEELRQLIVAHLSGNMNFEIIREKRLTEYSDIDLLIENVPQGYKESAKFQIEQAANRYKKLAEHLTSLR